MIALVCVCVRCFVLLQVWLVLVLLCCYSEKVPRLQCEIDFCCLFFLSYITHTHTHIIYYKIVQQKKGFSLSLRHSPEYMFEFIVLSSFVLHFCNTVRCTTEIESQSISVSQLAVLFQLIGNNTTKYVRQEQAFGVCMRVYVFVHGKYFDSQWYYH